MDDLFFEHPILNSPYEYSAHHWELDAHGQPTQQIAESHRKAEFITPIPKPKKRKISEIRKSIIFDEGAGLSTQKQLYDNRWSNSRHARQELGKDKKETTWTVEQPSSAANVGRRMR
jgi:type III restriction enzyme